MAMARKKEAARKKKMSSASVAAAAASVAVQARFSKLEDSVDLMQLREGGGEAGAGAGQGVWELVTARDKMAMVGVKLLDTLLSGYTVGLLVYSLMLNSVLLSAEVFSIFSLPSETSLEDDDLQRLWPVDWLRKSSHIISVQTGRAYILQLPHPDY